MRTTLGVEVLLEDPGVLAGDRVGLVTNHTGVTSTLRYTRVELLRWGVDLRRLFAPEHGIWGIAAAEESVDDFVDDLTELPGQSLYGKRRRPTSAALADIDTLLYDVQDIGVRCWTYTTTMVECMRAAAETGCRFMVLDRPNPLSGAPISGAVMAPEWESFVGLRGLPLLYDLTIGELARYAADLYEIEVNLAVMRLEGWDRGMWYDETGLPWVPSIPPLSGLEKALVYPATVFFEGTNVSVGWGTGRGPKLVGAPWLDRESTLEMARDRLAESGQVGVRLRADRFRPGSGVISEYVGEVCDGFEVHVTDRDGFEPVKTGLCLLSAIAECNDPFSWTESDAEFPGRYWTDVLAGTRDYRTLIDAGDSIDEVLAVAERGLSEYRANRASALLY